MSWIAKKYASSIHPEPFHLSERDEPHPPQISKAQFTPDRNHEDEVVVKRTQGSWMQGEGVL